MIQTSGSAVVDVSGQAIVRVGPGRAHEQWRVTRVAVLLDGVTDPTGDVRVYLDTIDPSTFIGGTHDGAADSSDEDLALAPGQTLVLVWSAVAPVGGRATAIVTHELESPG